MTDVQIIDLAEQRTAVRRAVLPADRLRAFFEETYPMIAAAVQAQGLRPAGPPFARYYGMPGASVDLEIGFPVEDGFVDDGEVTAGTLPACRALVAMHVGPYEGLAGTWQAMAVRGGELGATRDDRSFWEVYLSDPGLEPDPARWRTQLVQPLA
jgi:effector-binding domain-containing protein